MIKTREGGNRFPHSSERPNCISLELLKERRKPGDPEKEVGWNHNLWIAVSAATVWSSSVRGLRSCGDRRFIAGEMAFNIRAKVRAVKTENGARPLLSVA